MYIYIYTYVYIYIYIYTRIYVRAARAFDSLFRGPFACIYGIRAWL